MSDINHSIVLADNPELNSSFSWLNRRLALSVFLAFVTGMTFFTSEHTIDMSKNNTLNFVQDIEDQESWSEGGNKVRQVSFLACAGIGFLSLVFGNTGRFRINLPVVLIVIYVLWMGASVLWSIEPGTTMRRYALVICCVIGCFGFARFLQVEDTVLAAVLISLAYLAVGVAAEIFYGSFRPHHAGYRFAGTIHPNIQGASLAIGSIAAYTMTKVKPRAKIVFYGLFLILFLFLVLTKCRSATGAVPVAIGMIWLASQPRQTIFAGAMAGVWLLTSAVLICIVSDFNPITANQEVLLMGRGEETGSSLTGRLPLWQDLLEYVSVKPMSGYGFGAFWTPRHIYEIAVSQEWTISEAHSSYLDTTLQLGIVGVILMTLVQVSTLLYSAHMFRVTALPAYLFLVGGVSFCLLRGLTESGLTGASMISATLFLALAAHSWNNSEPIAEQAKNAT